MEGVFGAGMDEAGSREVVDAALVACLGQPSPQEPADEGLALVLPEAGEDGELRYPCALGDSRPLTAALGPRRGLEALCAVARQLAAWHADGQVCGDLRPETVRVRGDETLLCAAPGRDALGVLRWRLAQGAEAEAVAWFAPEVLDGRSPEPAADVYALAALAFGLIAERPPLGQIHPLQDMEPFARGPHLVLHQALRADPSCRPPLGKLRAALEQQLASLGPARAGGPQRLPEKPREESSMSGILVLLLILGGIFAFVGAVGVVVVSWDFLGDSGRFLLLLVLTLGMVVGGFALRARGFGRSGLALLALGSQLLWADAAFLLIEMRLDDEPEPWTVAAGLITALGLGAALRLRSATLGLLSAAGFCVFAGALGASLSSGTDVGPALYTGLVAVGAAGVAALAHRLAGLRVGVPYALVAVFAALASAVLGLVLVDPGEGAPLFGIAWPYAVALLVALPAFRRVRQPYFAFSCGVALLLAVLVPNVEALVRNDELVFTLVAVGLGLLTITAAFQLPALRERTALRSLFVLVGLAQSTCALAILALAHCGGEAGFALMEDAMRSPQAMVTGAFAYLELVLGLSLGLVGLGWLFSRDAERKTDYRLLEVAGLSLFGFVFTVLSLTETDDFFYPLVILGGGVLVLVLGVVSRRAALVLVATVLLLVNLWIQYFAKLYDHVPLALLLLGFGLAVLAGGILYERRVRHLLPELKTWA